MITETTASTITIHSEVLVKDRLRPNGFSSTMGVMWNWWIGSIPPPAAMLSFPVVRPSQAALRSIRLRTAIRPGGRTRTEPIDGSQAGDGSDHHEGDQQERRRSQPPVAEVPDQGACDDAACEIRRGAKA